MVTSWESRREKPNKHQEVYDKDRMWHWMSFEWEGICCHLWVLFCDFCPYASVFRVIYWEDQNKVGSFSFSLCMYLGWLGVDQRGSETRINSNPFSLAINKILSFYLFLMYFNKLYIIFFHFYLLTFFNS